MTPEERQQTRDLLAAASQGDWRYENLNWVGPPLFAVYAEKKYGARDATVLDNVEPDSKAYNNIEFMIAAHNSFPKVLEHIEALEANLAAAKQGKAGSAAPVLGAKEISALKEICEDSTQGAWSWEPEPQLGEGIYTVYAGRTGMAHGYNLFGRMDTGPNAEANLDFITRAHDLMPKALAHIETLDSELAQFRKPAASKPAQGPRP